MKNKTVIIVLGPTAVGKTAIALQLAQELRTDIISADSRQCFRELNIGVAKPDKSELLAVRHYFISSHSVVDNFHAALFETMSLQIAGEIFREKDKLIMVGGTGLYINAFCKGLHEIPDVDRDVRESVRLQYHHKGIAWLQEQIRTADNEFYAHGEIFNPQRMMRALEVKWSTGKSILSFRTQKNKQRPFKIIKVGMRLPKEELLGNIDRRTDHMLEEGLLEEVKDLQQYRQLNALKSVGYTEIFDYLEGKTSLDQAISMIKKNTWRYAKRQITWFNRDQEIQWLDPANISRIKKVTES